MSRSYKKTPVLKDSNTSKKRMKLGRFMIIGYMMLKNDG